MDSGGLNDDAMPQMTGVDPAIIAQRRARIVAELSAELGLPGEDVAAALNAIAASTARSNGGRAEIDGNATSVVTSRSTGRRRAEPGGICSG